MPGNNWTKALYGFYIRDLTNTSILSVGCMNPDQCLKLGPRTILHAVCFTPNWYGAFYRILEIIKCLRQCCRTMMTSSNGNIFRVTGPLCGEFTGPGELPTQRPVTRSFDVFFDLRLNKRLSKQPWGWWFETLSWSLWRQCNDTTKR